MGSYIVPYRPAELPVLMSVAAMDMPQPGAPRDPTRGASAGMKSSGGILRSAPSEAEAAPALIPEAGAVGFSTGGGADLSAGMSVFNPVNPFAGRSPRVKRVKAAAATPKAPRTLSTAQQPTSAVVPETASLAPEVNVVHRLPVSYHLPTGHFIKRGSDTRSTNPSLGLLTQLMILLSAIGLAYYTNLPFVLGLSRKAGI